MQIGYLFYSLFVWRSALARNIPKHHSQVPIAEQQPLASPHPAKVILAFTSSGSDDVRLMEVPLQKLIFSGSWKRLDDITDIS